MPKGSPIDGTATTRARLACNRCKGRKTKCTGGTPCLACSMSASDCVYPRKPKKIKVYDTDYEALEEEVQNLRQKLQMTDDTPESDSMHDRYSPTLKLSVLLSSPASELICWNLMNFMHSKKVEDLTISPDFNSFIEDDSYDRFFTRTDAANKTHPLVLLKLLTFHQVQNYLGFITNFINIGYLTINPVDFMERLRIYFNEDGTFNEDRYKLFDFFNLEILMVIALGSVYDSSTSIGQGLPVQRPPNGELPGLRYFDTAVSNLPNTFQSVNFDSKNIRSTLQLIELLGMVAVYSRILDKKSASCYFTVNALQLCISLNLHKESILTKSSEVQNTSANRNIFWSIYCLNRFSAVRIGQPLLLSFNEVKLGYDCNNQADDSNFYMFKNTTRFNIELAKISERINTEVYNSKFQPKAYLTNIFSILESLKTWSKELPPELRLDIDNLDKNPNMRSLSSLHLNHLHHIYLVCIPILLHFGKMKLLHFKKDNNLLLLKLSSLPTNIENLIRYSIRSSQLTSSMFSKLYEQRIISTFGFTDLDFLFSTSLVSIICLLLNFEDNTVYDTFEEDLNVCTKVMTDMQGMGNLIAKSKLEQVKDLINQFNSFFLNININIGIEKDNENALESNEFNFDALDQFNDTLGNYFSLTKEDLDFMERVLNENDILADIFS